MEYLLEEKKDYISDGPSMSRRDGCTEASPTLVEAKTGCLLLSNPLR
jgi:hypothetical protein